MRENSSISDNGSMHENTSKGLKSRALEQKVGPAGQPAYIMTINYEYLITCESSIILKVSHGHKWIVIITCESWRLLKKWIIYY